MASGRTLAGRRPALLIALGLGVAVAVATASVVLVARHRSGSPAPASAPSSASSQTSSASAGSATPAPRPTPTSKPTPTATPPPAPGVVPLPLISRGVPSFASSGTASGANDNSYATHWRSTGVPAWIAYDLSGVPVARRQSDLLVYYNSSYAYDTVHGPHYNNLGSYTIEASTAPGGGKPPAAGWSTLVSVAANTLHSRQHLVELGGANWIRVDVTASDGSPGNTDAEADMLDVYDVSAFMTPLPDDFIFYGDSVTAGGMITGGGTAIAPLLHTASPGHVPVMENGGEPFDKSADAVRRILGPGGYLALFPGKYVGLSYGMNDAAAAGGQVAFYNNMRQLVQAVLAAGRIPMIPTISYTNDPVHNANIPALNAEIQRLYGQFPQIVHGPDLWTYFKSHPSLVGAHDIHPTAQGFAALRQLWVDTIVSSIY